MTDPTHGYDYDDGGAGECWQCGGEGRVAGTCIDGFCAEQDDPDCEYCSRRCDVCNQQITCRNCKDPIDDGHKEFCGMCREMGCT